MTASRFVPAPPAPPPDPSARVELAEIGGLCPVCLTAYACGVAAWIGAIGLARRAYRRSHGAPPATDPA